MSKEIISDGNDFVVERLDRSFGGARSTVLSISGTDGSIAFHGADPVAQAAAYTQTYSTAARTMPAATSHTITDSSGGSASTSAIAAVTQAANVGSADVGPVKDNFATLAAELALVKADLVAAKKVINSLIDDLQALGLVG